MEFEIKYENKEPIKDLFQVLELLTETIRSKTERRLKIDNGGDHYIEVALFNSGYTRGEYTSSDYYLISPEITKELKDKRFLKPTPHWGYTDDKELSLNEAGTRFYWEEQERRQSTQKNQPEHRTG